MPAPWKAIAIRPPTTTPANSEGIGGYFRTARKITSAAGSSSSGDIQKFACSAPVIAWIVSNEVC
jgi:hypothetical protein